jgi:hypothetical protein
MGSTKYEVEFKPKGDTCRQHYHLIDSRMRHSTSIMLILDKHYYKAIEPG